MIYNTTTQFLLKHHTIEHLFLQYVIAEGKVHSLPTGKLIPLQQLTGVIIFPLA